MPQQAPQAGKGVGPGPCAPLAGGGELLQPLPGLFDEMLSPFAMKPRDRVLVRVLLRLLRLPGGAWLLRTWHASRA